MKRLSIFQGLGCVGIASAIIHLGAAFVIALRADSSNVQEIGVGFPILWFFLLVTCFVVSVQLVLKKTIPLAFRIWFGLLTFIFLVSGLASGYKMTLTEMPRDVWMFLAYISVFGFFGSAGCGILSQRLKKRKT